MEENKVYHLLIIWGISLLGANYLDYIITQIRLKRIMNKDNSNINKVISIEYSRSERSILYEKLMAICCIVLNFYMLLYLLEK